MAHSVPIDRAALLTRSAENLEVGIIWLPKQVSDRCTLG
jgi:hypothetical protein